VETGQDKLHLCTCDIQSTCKANKKSFVFLPLLRNRELVVLCSCHSIVRVPRVFAASAWTVRLRPQPNRLAWECEPTPALLPLQADRQGMDIGTLYPPLIHIAHGGDSLKDPASPALTDLDHANPGRAAGADMRVGCERIRAAQRHKNVTAVGRGDQQIRRRVVADTTGERNLIDNLVRLRLDDPDKVSSSIGHPEIAVVLGQVAP
jgi:hypothetical protein